MLNADLPWHNFALAADANNDGYVSTMDCLTIINVLNLNGPHQLANPEGPVEDFLDTSGDGYLSPRDALFAINQVNAQLAAGSADSSAMGDDSVLQGLWVPAENSGGSDGGSDGGLDYSVSSKGDVKFSLGVPPNQTNFVSAAVVVIGKKTKAVTYDLDLSKSQDGQPHDDFTDSKHDQGPVQLVKDELAEIDVSQIMPATMSPGQDTIGLHFEMKNVKIVGLKYFFEGPAGSTLR